MGSFPSRFNVSGPKDPIAWTRVGSKEGRREAGKGGGEGGKGGGEGGKGGGERGKGGCFFSMAHIFDPCTICCGKSDVDQPTYLGPTYNVPI